MGGWLMGPRPRVILTAAVIVSGVLGAGSGHAASPTPVAQPVAFLVTVSPVNGGTPYQGSGAGAVVPLNLTTNTLGTPVPFGVSSATGVLGITPDGKTAYMITGHGPALDGTGGVPGAVVPINLTTNTPGAPVLAPVGTWPTAVATTPDGKTAYVSTSSGNALRGLGALDHGDVVPINLMTNTPGTPIPTPAGTDPITLAITPDGKTAYVTTMNPSGPGAVVPINLVTNTLGTPIPIPLLTLGPNRSPGGVNLPNAIAITPDGKTAYVTNYVFTENAPGTDAVVPINLVTNTPGPPIQVGGGTGRIQDIAITPDGKTAYVTIDQSGSTYITAVVPINLVTNTPRTPIPLPSGTVGISDIAITPDGATAYVIGTGNAGGFVAPINLMANTVGTPIPVPPGTDPFGIVITPVAKTSSFEEPCTFESLSDTSGVDGVLFSIKGDTNTETDKQWRSDGSGRVVIRQGVGAGLEALWGFTFTSGKLAGLQADANVSGVFEWDHASTYEVPLSQVLRLVDALNANESINIGPRWLEQQAGVVLGGEVGFSAGPATAGASVGFQGFGGYEDDTILGERTYFGTANVSANLSGKLGILGLSTGAELTHKISVTVDKNQRPIQLSIETAVGTSNGVQLQVAKDADLVKAVANAAATDDQSVSSVATITADLDLTKPGNYALTQEFFSRLADVAATAVETSVYSPGSAPAAAVAALAAAEQPISDRSTITASQSQQSVNDASVGFQVGAGIAFGFGVRNRAVAEQVNGNAVYRMPGMAYTKWDACLSPKSS
jgi:DNA-binding beta-propeller fold protein YncE